MRTRLMKPWPDTVNEMVTQLLKKPDDAWTKFSPAICMTCGDAWILLKSEDSQFTRVHHCQKGVRYNIRVSVERIGSTRDERDELGHAYRAVIK
jgi:hypothetical protein